MKKFAFFLIVVHCILSFSPALSSGIYSKLDFGIMGILLAIFVNYIKTPYFRKILFYFLFFFLFIVLYYLAGYSKGQFGRICYPLPEFFFSIFITMFCWEKMSGKQIKTLLMVILPFAFVTILYNSIFCTWNPYASFDAINNAYYRNINIGATKFSHFSLSCFLLSFCVFLDTKTRLVRILFLFFSLLSAYYVIQCGQRTTVILFLIIAIVVILLSKFSKNTYSLVALTIVFVIFILTFLESFLDILIQNIGSERVAYRLNSLIDTSEYGVDEDSFSGRMYFYMMSIETFFDNVANFIFGVGYHETETSNRHFIGIGGHSQIFDLLAMYGVFGAFFIFCILRNTLLYLRSIINVRFRNEFLTVFMIFISISFLKYTFDDHNSLILFTALPLIYKILDQSTIENK